MDAAKPQNNLWFVIGWFGTTLLTLTLSAILLIHISSVKVVVLKPQNLKIYAALPEAYLVSEGVAIVSDGRANIIDDFFKRYNSILSGYGDIFIASSDENKLDWRLLPSIAMQESNGGKKIISNSFNPFGYGIYGNTVIRFSSWDEAILKVGQKLREDYLNKGLSTPYQIMTKYTPSSLDKGGAWAIGVSTFMGELK